jgi:hypothetical protein
MDSESLLIQQAENDELEASRLIDEISEEEEKARIEYEKAVADYEKTLDDIAKIDVENFNQDKEVADYLATRDNIISYAYADAKREEEARIEREKNERIAMLARATDLQNLGLIPADATNQERIFLVKQLEKTQQLKEEELEKLYLKRAPDVNERVKRHRALVKAHDEFQMKYKQEILEFRYKSPYIKRQRGYNKRDNIQKTYDVDAIELKEVGTEWLMTGTRTNALPRMGHLFRVMYKLDDVKGSYNDYIGYKYNPSINKWEEMPGGWKNSTIEAPLNTENQASFFREGIFPYLDWLPLVLKETRENTKNKFYAHLGNRHNNYKAGRWSEKRAFEPCKPGYWFYEDIPEIASQCVYMGGTFVDDDFSYYPRSTGIDYNINDSIDWAEKQLITTLTETGNEEYKDILKTPEGAQEIIKESGLIKNEELQDAVLEQITKENQQIGVEGIVNAPIKFYDPAIKDPPPPQGKEFLDFAKQNSWQWKGQNLS